MELSTFFFFFKKKKFINILVFNNIILILNADMNTDMLIEIHTINFDRKV
jgi:hypothetical protein